MKRSLSSVLGSNRSGLLSLALLFALAIYGIVVLKSDAKSRPTYASQINGQILGPIVGTPVAFGISVQARELSSIPRTFPELDAFGNIEEDHERENDDMINPIVPGYGAGAERFALTPFVDPLLAKNDLFSPQSMPTPELSFEGVSSNDRSAVFGNRVMPPDTNGDVGPNHYVSSVNGPVGVYNKNTGLLAGPLFRLSSLFTSLPTTSGCGTRDDGDPVALYDPLADRWILSQFALPTGSSTGPWFECIAVSQTGDPLGAYFVYAFQTPSGSGFPDYPKLGIWRDAIYMTDHQNGFSSLPSGGGSGTGFFAFDRSKMLVGDPSATYVYFNRPTAGEGGIIPADMDGPTAPPVNVPMTFFRYIADEFGAGFVDGVRAYEFVPDFTSPASSTLTIRPDIPGAAFDARQPSGRADIEQPSPALPANNLDSLDDRAMSRVPYHNLGTQADPVNSYVMAWGVNVSGAPAGTLTATSFTAGIRWTELRRDADGTITIRDQGTQANASVDGATGVNYWMPHAAQDNQGNIAVGFSASGTTVNPGIKWAGRTGSSPAGTLNEGEATMFVGDGVQLATNSRWGDYSSMSVDPSDDCTFYYHQEYRSLANNGISNGFGWNTRVGRFKYPTCTPPPSATITGTVTSCATGLPLNQASVTATGGYNRSTIANGTYSMKVSPGSYTLTGGKLGGYSGANANTSVDGGGTSTVNICLAPIAVVGAGSTSIVSESCGVSNAAADPGEIITISLPISNTGAADTADLTATLQATGGVTVPSGTQTYGVVPAGGAPVVKNFTFKVDPALLCGNVVTLTWNLQDGATSFGTVTKTIGTGTPIVTLTQNFDGVTAPALPAAWVQNQTSGTGITWVTSTTTPKSTPNSAFANDPTTANAAAIESPVFAVTAPLATVSFQKAFSTEAGFDGVVLEIKIGAGAWTDIETAGGSFVTGGYTGTLASGSGNPIGGRQAWSGASTTFTATQVTLPSAANGQNVQLRWLMGSDVGTGGPGFRLDDVVISGAVECSVCVATNKAPFDFDNDGKTDISVFRPSNNNWYLNRSTAGFAAFQFGAADDIMTPADFTGDGKTDVAVFRPSIGTWFIMRSEDNTFFGVGFGTNGDIPAPADYDGDGKADQAVFRPSNGSWYLQRSTAGFSAVGFGSSGDQPSIGDFDGDGKSDIAVYRPSTGYWYRLNSSNGTFFAVQFGTSGDKIVPADYTGDGKTDVAVWRPSIGTWFVLKSEDLSFYGVGFGLPTDLPAPGDFDGDGKCDVAVFRPSSGTWFMIQSSSGFNAVGFGSTGDRPAPNAFVF